MPGMSVALAALRGAIVAQSRYEILLKEDVFPQVSIEDKKSAISYQKTLLSNYSMNVLLIIWKESSFVPDEVLDSVGLTKRFSHEKPMTCYSLAVSITDGAQDFGRVHKRIETIVAAGVAYGLVELTPLSNARWKQLRGTERLAQFMIGLGTSFHEIFSMTSSQEEGCS